MVFGLFMKLEFFPGDEMLPLRVEKEEILCMSSLSPLPALLELSFL